MARSLELQRHELPFKAVLIEVLNISKEAICSASGFIRREGQSLYLYTCWHVVTGFDKNDIKIPHQPPDRAFLKISLQNVQRSENVVGVGGSQSIVIPLYDAFQKRALWLQDDKHVPNADLNSIGIYVPSLHDAVKLLLPQETNTFDIQVVREDDLLPMEGLLTCGEKIYVVGYPYGYSATGHGTPTPIVLTRHIAALQVEGRSMEILLESAGAPVMSGGPVFVERAHGIYLLGVYTGLIYPDHLIGKNEKSTALGACSNMVLCFRGHLPLVTTPTPSDYLRRCFPQENTDP